MNTLDEFLKLRPKRLEQIKRRDNLFLEARTLTKQCPHILVDFLLFYNQHSTKQSEVMYGGSIWDTFTKGGNYLKENQIVLDNLKSALESKNPCLTMAALNIDMSRLLTSPDK